MITVEQEEKLAKYFALIGLLPLLAVKDDMLKVYILIPVLTVSIVLVVRKYLRDKKAGKPLVRYYIALGFVLLSFVLAYVFYLVSVR